MEKTNLQRFDARPSLLLAPSKTFIYTFLPGLSTASKGTAQQARTAWEDRAWPNELALLQPFGQHAQTDPVVPYQFDQPGAAAPEGEHGAIEWDAEELMDALCKVIDEDDKLLQVELLSLTLTVARLGSVILAMRLGRLIIDEMIAEGREG